MSSRPELRLAALLVVVAIAGPGMVQAAPFDCEVWLRGYGPGSPADANLVAATARQCLAAADTDREAAIAHGWLTELLLLSGDHVAADQHAEAAVEAAARTDDPLVVARTIQVLGDAHYSRWRYRSARLAFREALAVAESSLGLELQARLLKDLAITERTLGNLERALPLFEAATNRWPEWRRSNLAVSILGNQAETYLRLGALDLAAEALEDAWRLPLADHERADILLRRGRLALAAGNLDDARRHLTEADRIAAVASSDGDRAWIASLLVFVETTSGDLVAAAELAERALRIHERAGDARSVSVDLVTIADVALRRGRPDAAADALRRANELVAEGAAADWPWLPFVNARLALDRGDVDGARRLLERAADLAAEEVGRLASSRQRQVRAGGYDEIFDALVALALDESGADAADLALDALERHRTLRETIAVHELVDDPRPTLTADLRTRLEALEDRAERLGADLPPRGSASATELARTELEIDEILAAARRDDAAGPTTPSAAGRAEVAAALSTAEALIELRLLPERVVVLLVTPTTTAVRVATAPAADVISRAATLAALIRAGKPGWRPVAERLGADLLGPVAELLPHPLERLFVVPDDRLHGIPFDLLPVVDGGPPLLDLCEVAVQPSATSFVRSRRRGAPAPSTGAGRVLLIANPAMELAAGPPVDDRVWGLYRSVAGDLGPIPATLREARTIAGLVGGVVPLVGRDALESAASRQAAEGRFGIIHVAAHALSGPSSPARSALLLRPSADGREDGMWQAREISRLDLDADLVVLSACHSVEGPRALHHGVQGLAKGFFAAGARSVVGTLWSVDDAGTARLMESLYRRLAAGETIGRALRDAKLERRAGGDRHPGEWAPFVLIGDGSSTVDLERRRGVSTAAAFAVGLALAAAIAAWLGYRMK